MLAHTKTSGLSNDSPPANNGPRANDGTPGVRFT